MQGTIEMMCQECDKDRKSLGRLLAAVLAVADVGIVVFDERGRFVMASPSFQSLFSWRSAAYQSEHFSTLFPDAKLPSSAIRLPRSISAGRYQTRIRAGDGSLIPIAVHARWITQEGEDSYWVASLTPIETKAVTPEAKPDNRSVPTLSDGSADSWTIRQKVRDSMCGPYMVAGQVAVTKLDVIQQAAGSQWPQVASHIFAEAERIVAENLSLADTFIHDGQGNFTVCFGDALLDGAELRMSDIAQGMRNRLTGQFGVAAAPQAESHTEQIPLAPDELDVPDIGALIASRLAAKRALIERASALTLNQVIETARLETQEVISSSGRPIHLSVVQLNRTTARAVQKIMSLSSNPDGVADQIDHLLLGLAATQLYDAMGKGTPPTFVVPVSYRTFVNRRLLDRYLGLCRSFSTGLTKHLMFDLVDVPNDVAGMRVEDILASLRPFSRQLCLRLAEVDRGAVKLWSRHFSYFTVHYDRIQRSSSGGEALDSLLQLLQQRRSRLGVQSVPDLTTARRLADAGVSFVSGTGLQPWAES